MIQECILKTYSSTKFGRNYLPILCKLILKWQELKQSKNYKATLWEKSICKQIFADTVKSKYKSLEVENSKWITWREALEISVNKFMLGINKRKEKSRNWCQMEFLRWQQRMLRNGTEYRCLRNPLKTNANSIS